MKSKAAVPVGANPAGHVPKVDDDAFVHPSAQVIGNVRIGQHVFVGPVAVIRADEPGTKGQVRPIVIKPRSNIQDGVILHALGGSAISIESGTSIAHGAVVHGPCKCGANCFVGFGAVVFNSTLGDGVYVGAGAVVQNVRLRASALVPPGSVIVSQEAADRLKQVGKRDRQFVQKVARTNVQLAKDYSRLRRAGAGG